MAETPMMQQYTEIKRQNPDCIIFFRLGDFYEMFGDDAVIASRELDLVLTSRSKNVPEEDKILCVECHIMQPRTTYQEW